MTNLWVETSATNQKIQSVNGAILNLGWSHLRFASSQDLSYPAVLLSINVSIDFINASQILEIVEGCGLTRVSPNRPYP